MAMLNNQMVILMGKLGFEQYDFWVPDFKQTDRYVTNNPGNSAKCFLTCGHHKNFATGGALQRNPNEQLEIHVYTMQCLARSRRGAPPRWAERATRGPRPDPGARKERCGSHS